MTFFRRLLQILLFLLIALIVIGGAGVWYISQDLPDVESLRNMQMQVPLQIFSADGKLLAEFGEKRREPVPLSEIPLKMQEAVIATEDQRFYQHSGVDFRGLLRAAFEVAASGRKVQGGSTITMQVARNFFLDRKKTYTRKAKEIMLALRISRELSKDKVLELYFNQVYFGKRAYGALAAAHIYYGEELNQLTLAQMAMLAGLPQAPSALNPINDPAAARERREHVLQRMLEQGYITKAEFTEANNALIVTHYHHLKVEVDAPYIAEMARDAMVQKYGDDAYTMGLNVYTTIDSHYQAAANRALENGLLSYDIRHGYRGAIDQWAVPAANDYGMTAKKLAAITTIADLQPALVLSVDTQQATVLLKNATTVTIPWAGLSWACKQFSQGKWVGNAPKTASEVVQPGDVVRVKKNNDTWTLSQLPDIEAALVSLNPQNGAIFALVGGFDFEKSKFNRVTDAQRQPGSNFKPFIYSGALDKGYTLATIVNDAPIVLQNQTDANFWRPQNDQRNFLGPIRLRVGLMQSRNLVSIRLVEDMGIPYLTEYAKKFGFPDAAIPQTLSVALGTGVVTPLQLARGFSTFANGGYLITPYFIDHVTDSNHKVLFTASPAVACDTCFTAAAPTTDNLAPRIISPQTAYLMNSALKSIIGPGGTGAPALVLKRNDLGGKTGTTQDQTDGWFSGFNGKVLTVTWLGYDQQRTTFEYGGQTPLNMWIDYMDAVLKGTPDANLPRPPDIVSVRINTKTGLATGAADQNAIFEIFRKENAPVYTSTTSIAKSVDDSHAGNKEHSDEQPIF